MADLAAWRRVSVLIERNARLHRRVWLVFISGIVEPLVFLAAFGMGIGQLVGTITVGGRQVSYAGFVAPAMLAVCVMYGVLAESTFNFFGKLKFGRLFDAYLATPLSPGELAFGEALWGVVRGGVYASVFLAFMALLELTPSWWALAAVPGALLVGFAFAGLGMLVTSYVRSWDDLDLVSVVTFLFFIGSGTFTPVERLPGWLRLLVELTPLYHAVEVIRNLVLGTVSTALLAHAAYLLAAGVVGLRVASRRMAHLLAW